MNPLALDNLRQALQRDKLADEHHLVQQLLDEIPLAPAQLDETLDRARASVTAWRNRCCECLMPTLPIVL